MAKKMFFGPIVLTGNGGLDDGGDGNVIGHGSGQYTTDPFPMSFEDWNKAFAADYDLDDDIDMGDYMTWWEDCGFSMEAWDEFNPGVDFDPESYYKP